MRGVARRRRGEGRATAAFSRAGASRDGGVLRSFHIWAASDVDQMFSSAVRSRFEVPGRYAVVQRPALQLSLARGVGNVQRTAKDLDLNGEQLSRPDALQIASCFHSPSLVISVVLT